jgi:hypothetical protein
MSEQAAPQAPVAPAATETATQQAQPSQDQLALRKMAQREASLRREMAAIKAEKDAWVQKEQAWKQKEEEYSQKYIPRDKLETDPLGMLSELGYDNERVAQMLLNPQAPVPPYVEKLLKKIEALEQGQQQSKTEAEKQQQAQYETAINQVRNDVMNLVKTNESFEGIRASGAEEAVVQLIVETYNTENRLMSVEDAAQAVEDYVLEEALKLANIGKVKSKFAPPPVEVPEAQPQKQNIIPRQQSQLKTLTNSQTVSSRAPQTDRDRRARAIAAFQGKLNT